MLKHCVFVQFRDNVPAKDKQRVLAGFGDLVSQVDGMEDYAWGPNRDFEDKSGRYGDGFVVTFRDREAHLRYENHPVHQALGAEMVSMCEGGHDGIIVFDIECAD